METIKTSHLNIRISELSKNVLQRAAELHGDSLSHFVVTQALERAQEVLSKEQIITLDKDAQLRFLDLLENPPAINQKLAKAITHYKKVMNNDSEV